MWGWYDETQDYTIWWVSLTSDFHSHQKIYVKKPKLLWEKQILFKRKNLKFVDSVYTFMNINCAVLRQYELLGVVVAVIRLQMYIEIASCEYFIIMQWFCPIILPVNNQNQNDLPFLYVHPKKNLIELDSKLCCSLQVACRVARKNNGSNFVRAPPISWNILRERIRHCRRVSVWQL